MYKIPDNIGAKDLIRIKYFLKYIFFIALGVYLVVVQLLTDIKIKDGDFGLLFSALHLGVVAVVAIQLILLRWYRKNFVGRPPKAKDAQVWIKRIYFHTLLVFALSEIPAILGVVYYFSTGNKRDFYPFLLMSLLVFISFFPRDNNLLDIS